MSFPKYPEYRDSGVEWLGEVPVHWSVSALKRRFRIEGGSTPSPDELNWDGVISWATPADLSGLSSLFLNETKRTITPEGLASCGATILPAGSLLLSTRAPIGSLAISVKEMCTNQGCKGLVPNHNSSSNYYAHVLLAAKDELNNRGRGTTFLEISADELGRFCIPAPPMVEQTQIARFLDHETACIDALIEEQQRLIELLKEKRQAVISHAVTKGLDPSVPMKDSGVEWLGEVPAHWEVVPLKHVVSTPITDGPHETPEFIDDGVLFISAEAVSSGRINFDKARYISREDHFRYSRKYLPKRHDIYMVKSGATTGVTAIVETDDEFNIWSPLAVIRCKPEYEPYFVFYSMRSRNFQESVIVNWSFGTQQNIGMGVIENLPIACPPMNEQLAIAEFISNQLGQWDRLIDEGEKAISFLKERRSALISAAVTGKIDLRGWQPPARAQAPELEVEAV